MVNENKIPQGYIASKDMKSRSDYYQLLQAAKEGEVFMVKRGLYVREEDLAKQMIDIGKIVPGSVLCMYSAWSYYQLTTQIPLSYCLAVRRGRKVVLPEYPPVSLYRWSDVPYSLGIEEKEIEGFKINIYNIEKSVCDAVKYRNKIGIDICAEIVKTYLKRKERKIDRLMDYAKLLRVDKTLKSYLEIEL